MIREDDLVTVLSLGRETEENLGSKSLYSVPRQKFETHNSRIQDKHQTPESVGILND